MSIKRVLALAGVLAAVGSGGLNGQMVLPDGYGEGALISANDPPGGAGTLGRGSELDAFLREFPDALVYRGVMLFSQGDYQEAARAWEQYLEVAPPDADTVSVNAMIEEAFIREFPDALLYKGLSLFNGGEYQGAVDALERYLELAPPEADRASVRAMIEKVRRIGSAKVR